MLECPSPKQLRDWLDDQFNLREAECEHVRQCEACQARLEKFTSAPDLSRFIEISALVSSGSNRLAPFYGEAELQQIRNRLREHSSATRGTAPLGSTHLTSSETEPLADANDAQSIKDLQSRLPGDRYLLARALAQGGCGSVYLAFDQSLARDVAIKVLHRTSSRDHQRLAREARTMADLSHDNVVRVFDVGKLETTESTKSPMETPFLVMEYIDGGTASSLALPATPQEYQHLARLMAGAARGLAAAHAAGLIHRDVKPSNLLVNRSRTQLKVSDFGLVKLLDSESTQMTRTDEVVGTPAFMSPEQIGASDGLSPPSNDMLTSSTDIHSLGATLYALLTGRPPFAGTTAAVLRQIVETEPVAARVLNPEIPRDLETICLRALEKSPKNRYPNMLAFAADLERFAAGESPLAKPLSSWTRLRRWAEKNRALAASGLISLTLLSLLAIAGVSAAAIFWKQNQNILAAQALATRELCNKIALADPSALSLSISQLDPEDERLREYMVSLWSAADRRQQINLACALTIIGEDRTQFLVKQIGDCVTTPGQCEALCLALSRQPAVSLAAIANQMDNHASVLERLKLAAVSMFLGEPKYARAVIVDSPNLRTRFTHLLPTWHAGVSRLSELAVGDNVQSNGGATVDEQTRACCCLALGLIDSQQFADQELKELKTRLMFASSQATTTGLIGAYDWLLRQKCDSRQPTDALSSKDLMSPSEARFGFRMVRIPHGEFEMGVAAFGAENNDMTPRHVKLTRDYWIADREVSVAEFRTYLSQRNEREEPLDAGSEAATAWTPDEITSPTAEHPAQSVTWLDATGFCNWLSQLDGFSPYYSELESIDVVLDDGTITLETRRIHSDASGYRLPSEAEFEYACRAGTQTWFFFGDDLEYMPYYAAWSNNSRIAAKPCGQLMPNPWGLFDVHGNVWEWTDDWYSVNETGQAVVDPLNQTPSPSGRVFRSGGVNTYTGYPASSCRGASSPESRFHNLGFRVARNVD